MCQDSHIVREHEAAPKIEPPIQLLACLWEGGTCRVGTGGGFLGRWMGGGRASEVDRLGDGAATGRGMLCALLREIAVYDTALQHVNVSQFLAGSRAFQGDNSGTGRLNFPWHTCQMLCHAF